MYSLIVKQFIRSRTVQLTFGLILFIGVVSILIGKQFLARKETSIAKVAQHQQEHIERYVKLNDEMGLLLYYLRFSLIDKPDKLTALSIGQRDINPSVQSVTIRTLEAQKYDTDLNNPSLLQSGNLDLGFVIIYLFPLLIIALCFNLLSEEKETNTWRLVAVQSRSALQFLLLKLSARALFIYAALGILFITAILVLPLPLNTGLLGFAVLSVLYLAFWFAFCFWIISFHRSSSFNVLILLSVWVLLAILLPASINNYVANQYPVPEAMSAMVKQRDGYHKKWDMDKKVTMDKFYAQYPRFAKYGIPEDDNFWIWYYAMQHMGDYESLRESKAMREKIKQREKASRSLAVVIPTMHTQLALNDIAGASLSNHMRLLDNTNKFHERTRLYFYPRIFEKALVKSENWEKFTAEYISKETKANWPRAAWPFLIFLGVLTVLGAVNLKRLKAV